MTKPLLYFIPQSSCRLHKLDSLVISEQQFTVYNLHKFHEYIILCTSAGKPMVTMDTRIAELET
jgi:hypothetical protein